MKIQRITALLLSCVLLLASCGGGETDTDMSEDTTVDTQTEETVDAEETEPEKTEEETKKTQQKNIILKKEKKRQHRRIQLKIKNKKISITIQE